MNDAQFLEVIRDRPDDEAVRLAYADWLDEHGHAYAAEYLRLEHQLTELSIWNPDYPRWHARLMRFGRQVEWSWQKRVSRCQLIDASKYLRLGRFLIELVQVIQQNPSAALNEPLEALCRQFAGPPNPQPPRLPLPTFLGYVSDEIDKLLENTSRDDELRDWLTACLEGQYEFRLDGVSTRAWLIDVVSFVRQFERRHD